MGSSKQVDLSEFEALTAVRGPRCQVMACLAGLSEGDRAKLTAALVAPHIESTGIAKWCKDRGFRVSDHSVGRHRRGMCACARV